MFFKSKQIFQDFNMFILDSLNIVSYTILQSFVSISMLKICWQIADDLKLNILQSIFIPLSICVMIFYYLAAYTNPGFIIGNEQIQLAKAYDFK